MNLKSDTEYIFKTGNTISDDGTIPLKQMQEIVRCEDCKFSHFIKSCSKYECEKCSGFLRYSNDFCSYGKRKGGDE